MAEIPQGHFIRKRQKQDHQDGGDQQCQGPKQPEERCTEQLMPSGRVPLEAFATTKNVHIQQSYLG
jgi:hypothetical protein